VTFLIFMLGGLFAGGIGSWLKERRGLLGKIRWGSGTVIMLLGIRLMLPQNT
jgi:hypothetical protein